MSSEENESNLIGLYMPIVSVSETKAKRVWRPFWRKPKPPAPKPSFGFSRVLDDAS